MNSEMMMMSSVIIVISTIWRNDKHTERGKCIFISAFLLNYSLLQFIYIELLGNACLHNTGINDVIKCGDFTLLPKTTHLLEVLFTEILGEVK